jgi:hypothetical protein
MTREKFQTRTIRLVGEQQLNTALALLPNLPIDAKNPLELVFREEVKARKLDQNGAMWAGTLKDIEQQAYFNGRRFSDVVWHEFFKEEFLPDDTMVCFDPEMVKDPIKYKKYDYTPKGKRVLVGSTTELTVKGFAIYLTQVEAFGANLGVQYRVNPKSLMVAA